MALPFTPADLAAFRRYVKVQKSGEYNMLDLRAANAAQLNRDQMVFIMSNYNELETANKEAADRQVKAAGAALEEAYPLGYRSEESAP